MSTSADYIEFLYDQIKNVGNVRYRKMFGEYMVYLNDKPVLLVCDNTPFVRKLECVQELLGNAETGIPYRGAKEQYILDVEDGDLTFQVLAALERIVPIPAKKKKTDKQPRSRHQS